MAIYYVDGELGNDVNNGLSPTSAWKTLTKAAATLIAGDIVYIKPWVYDHTYGQNLNPASNTTWIGDALGEHFGIKGIVLLVNFNGTSILYPTRSKENLTFKNLYCCSSATVFDFRNYPMKNILIENCFIVAHPFLRTAFIQNLVVKNCYIFALIVAIGGGYEYIRGENIKFEKCIVDSIRTRRLFRIPYWGNLLELQKCWFHALEGIRFFTKGGYPASILIDRCNVHGCFSALEEGVTAELTYRNITVLNSIIQSSYVNNKTKACNCLAFGTIPTNWIIEDIISGLQFFFYYVPDIPITDLRIQSRTLVSHTSQTLPVLKTDYYNWSYYKPITITNPNPANGGLENFQVKIEVDTASLIAAGKMQSFCEDIRFFSEDNEELSFWIEGGENTAQTIIWVKIPFLPGSSDTTIKMYYGNPYCHRKSDGGNTFEFFDHFVFATDRNAKWHILTADNTYSNSFDGTNIVLEPDYPGRLRINGVSCYSAHTKWVKVSRPIIIETKCRMSALTSYCGGLQYWVKTGYPNFNYASYHSFTNGTNAMLRYASSGGVITDYTGDTITLVTNTDYINQLVLTSTSVIGKWLNADRTVRGQVSLANIDWNNCYLGIDHLGTSTDYTYFDWIIVRKWTELEPTFTIGTEVTGTFTLYPVDMTDIYGRSQTHIGAIEIDYPPEVFKVKKLGFPGLSK